MIAYISIHYMSILQAVIEHLRLTILALLCSIPLAFLLFLVLFLTPKTIGTLLTGLLVTIYCIPSIALFTLLIPWFGLGEVTAIIGLTAYNQILLIRNIRASYDAIPRQIKEAAESLGISSRKCFQHIYLPLMLPYLIGGLRIVTISTMGIATMAALINAGGLGRILVEGMRMFSMPRILVAVILISGLALVLNFILIKLERVARRYATGYEVTA